MLDLVIGRRELGKTTLAVSLSRHSDTRVIFDPRHMISTTSDILTDGNVEEVLYDILDIRSEVIVRPHFDVEETFGKMCEQIYYWLLDHPGESFCLLVDEARFVKEPEKNKFFDYIVRCTKRDRVTTIITCHGIVDISTDLRRVADYWILFQLTLEADLERVYERCGSAVANAVQKLNPYEFIVWDDSHRTWLQRDESQAKSWYVNLESPQVERVA
jgi:hypothetical protein